MVRHAIQQVINKEVLQGKFEPKWPPSGVQKISNTPSLVIPWHVILSTSDPASRHEVMIEYCKIYI